MWKHKKELNSFWINNYTMEFQNLIQTQCTFVFLEKEKKEGNLTALDLLAFTKFLFVCLFVFFFFFGMKYTWETDTLELKSWCEISKGKKHKSKYEMGNVKSFLGGQSLYVQGPNLFLYNITKRFKSIGGSHGPPRLYVPLPLLEVSSMIEETVILE